MFKKLYGQYLHFEKKLSLSTFMFSVFLTLMLCACITSIIINIITKFPMIANLKWIVSIFLCLLGYWLIHKNLLVELFKFIIFLLALFLAILPSWFYGGGDNTITILYLIMLLIESFLMFDATLLDGFLP